MISKRFLQGWRLYLSCLKILIWMPDLCQRMALKSNQLLVLSWTLLNRLKFFSGFINFDKQKKVCCSLRLKFNTIFISTRLCSYFCVMLQYPKQQCFMSQGNVLFVHSVLEVIVLRRDQGMMKKRTSEERKGKEPEKKKRTFLVATQGSHTLVRLTKRNGFSQCSQEFLFVFFLGQTYGKTCEFLFWGMFQVKGIFVKYL